MTYRAEHGRRRNATYYGGDLRRDLLDAALRVIEVDGPSAVTLRALARELGVSHAAPANHFPDKTALFTALSVEGFRLLEQALAEGASAPGADAPAVDRLRAAGIAYMRFAVGHRAHFAVMWRNDLVDPDDAELTAAGDATFLRLTAAVGAAQAEGWASGADPRTVALMAWSTVHGLAALSLGGPLLEHDERSFDDVAGAVADLLVGALGGARPLAPEHVRRKVDQ